jgi:CMP-N,N'-diacetyllegionaminic acid synthase
MSTSGSNILAVIPARSGSKGLPGKNLRLLAGKSLICRAVEAARLSLGPDARIIVSTEDAATADHARTCGAEAPFLRPLALATDEARTIDVLMHAFYWMEEEAGFRADWVVLLQPTSPLRSPEDIRGALSLAVASGADSVVTVCSARQHPAWALFREDDGTVRTFLGGSLAEAERKYPRRQDLPTVFFENGAVYVVSGTSLRRTRSLYSGMVVAYVMPAERSVDIDGPVDFTLAEALLSAGGSHG